MSGFSATIMDHFAHPRNAGVLNDADVVGTSSLDDERPSLTVYLRVVGDRIVAVRYQTIACGVMIAAGSMLTELVIGKTVAECWALDERQLTAALGGVPPQKAHCPELAIAALRDALGKWAEPAGQE